ncbi:hypothetical protein CPC08DRAFT_721409 [Agrocybe pediades]|nr:hypothetical protein CPC08DRAFT_721409 [Agrocybe pediades]
MALQEYSHYQNGRQVKTEAEASPDLSPAGSISPFDFNKFNPSHGPLSHPQPLPNSIYRFGLWHNIPRISQPTNTMSYSDDYDDLPDIPALGNYPASSSNATDRAVRRRSSKACDQCRKSKCKCERTGPSEPCKNCIMLSTPCTFLGPSRKRGPPKGYIDAIEARLHQTEALLGIMLATPDPRAQSLLRDIGKDPLAKEIISRVDNSPYGTKGRKREDIALSIGGKIRSAHSSETSLPGQTKTESGVLDITSTHPSNEWQDKVATMLTSMLAPSDQQQAYTPRSHSSDENYSPGGRRQRRRLGDDEYAMNNDFTNAASTSTVSLNQLQPIDTASASTSRPNSKRGPQLSYSPIQGRFPVRKASRRTLDGGERRSSSVDENSMTSDSEEAFTGAVGQLSLNEDEQVRYHGKASGLHLLGNKERVDRRNEGGIWRFPKARVWPPLPSASNILSGEEEYAAQLPSEQIQKHLLDLYFTSYADSPQSSEADGPPNSASPFNRRRRPVATLLLLSMFALASRYDQTISPPPSDASIMWSAGDEYLDRAKVILDRSYSSSRPSTCQALLLMGYREIGIGAMAQAWTYIGMGIRMAQDLGMHRSADGWERAGLGRLFSESELNERKRIWYGCLIMDKYVSAYIGRPLMIFEWDFDTPLPNEDDPEELDEWSLDTPRGQRSPPVPGRVISCFNASATLSGILSMIAQTIYAVRPVSSRHAESTVLEGLLDKWYLELPEHLRYEPSLSSSSKSTTPLPNVLTLHMQYWCAVLLLHRPFIRHVVHAKQKQSEVSEDPETKALAAKSYELCNAAANHITSIVSLYQEKYMINRCSVFLCYYVFTASIMHDTNLTVHPDDPQARIGLSKCMNTLRAMQIVWPSAARALELFRGAKGDGTERGGGGGGGDLQSISLTHVSAERHKRFAGQATALISPYTYAAAPMRQSTGSAATHHAQRNSYSSSSHEHASGGGVFPAGNDVYLPTGVTHAAHAGGSSSSASSMVAPSGYSWSGGDMNPHNYNTPLSTAVLPQLFSTGLVDDATAVHGHLHGGRSIHSHASHPADQHQHQQHQQQQQQQHSRRYAPPPQYFDYSSYPAQMGGAAGYDIPDSVQHQHQQVAPSHPHQQMFIPEQYSLYNNPPYSSR